MRPNRRAEAGVLEWVVTQLRRVQLAGPELETQWFDSTIIKQRSGGAGALRKRGGKRSGVRGGPSSMRHALAADERILLSI